MTFDSISGCSHDHSNVDPAPDPPDPPLAAPPGSPSVDESSASNRFKEFEARLIGLAHKVSDQMAAHELAMEEAKRDREQ